MYQVVDVVVVIVAVAVDVVVVVVVIIVVSSCCTSSDYNEQKSLTLHAKVSELKRSRPPLEKELSVENEMHQAEVELEWAKQFSSLETDRVLAIGLEPHLGLY